MISSSGRRLLIFSSEDPAGGYGSATALRIFLRAAAEHTDWRIVVVAARGSDGAADVEGAQILRIPSGQHRITQLLAYVVGASAVALSPACPTADTVISWQPLPTGVPGWIAARRAGVAHVVRTCGPELAREWSRFPLVTMLARPLTRRLLASAEAVIVKSRLEYRLLPERILSNRVHEIPNAVEQRSEGTAPQRTPGVRVLAVGQLEKHKGMDRLVRAFAQGVIGCRHSAQLTIVGDGSQRASLERLARSTGAHITFSGRTAAVDMPAIYAGHDMLLVASAMEGCSNTCLEAMAAGLPVVGPRSALEGLVRDHVDGMLADGADVDALTAAVVRFFSSPSEWEVLGSTARRTAAQHQPEQLIRAYARMLEGLP